MDTKTAYRTKTPLIPEPRKLNRSLPKSWKKAAGVLRGKRKAMEQHLRKVRREWSA